MNALVLVSGNILAAIIAAAGVVWAAKIAKQGIESYRDQKDIDREVELTERQRVEYERYFQLFWTLQYLKPDSEEHERVYTLYQSARDNLSFYASDEGLRRLNEFHKYMVDHPKSEDKDKNEIENLYARMSLVLRKDCFGETDLTLEEIKSALTIEI